MSQSNQYPAGVYVKGNDARIARNSAAAVALVYSGYALAKTETKAEPDEVVAPVTDDAVLDGPSRSELQAMAKDLGIPANQSNEALQAAIDAATTPSDEN